MSLDRFKQAQDRPDAGFATALAELQAGRKISHWIWYIFPQLGSLGRSSTARFYGITDLSEACAYLNDALLHERLLQVTRVVADQLQRGAPISHLMGGETDSLKLVSSLTLFHWAAQTRAAQGGAGDFSRLLAASAEVLAAAERQGFPRCRHTEAACASPQ